MGAPRLTRRAMLLRAAGASAGLGLLAIGCGRAGPAAPAVATNAPADNPRKGGVVTWGQWDRNDDVDPALSSGAAALEVVTNVLEPLVAMDADEKIYPYLASSWNSDPEFKTW